MWVSQSFLLALSAHCSIRAKKEGRYRELERGGLNRKQNAFFEHKNKQKKTAYYKEQNPQNPKNETETQDGGKRTRATAIEFKLALMHIAIFQKSWS